MTIIYTHNQLFMKHSATTITTVLSGDML